MFFCGNKLFLCEYGREELEPVGLLPKKHHNRTNLECTPNGRKQQKGQGPWIVGEN